MLLLILPPLPLLLLLALLLLMMMLVPLLLLLLPLLWRWPRPLRRRRRLLLLLLLLGWRLGLLGVLVLLVMHRCHVEQRWQLQLRNVEHRLAGEAGCVNGTYHCHCQLLNATDDVCHHFRLASGRDCLKVQLQLQQLQPLLLLVLLVALLVMLLLPGLLHWHVRACSCCCCCCITKVKSILSHITNMNPGLVMHRHASKYQVILPRITPHQPFLTRQLPTSCLAVAE